MVHCPSRTSDHGSPERSHARTSSLTTTRLADQSTAAHHLDVVDDGDPLGDDPVRLGQEGADLVRLVDDDDAQREVLAEAEDAAGVDLVELAKALQTTQDRRTAESGVACAVDNLGVDGPVVPLIGLSDQDGQAQQPASFSPSRTSTPRSAPSSTAGTTAATPSSGQRPQTRSSSKPTVRQLQTRAARHLRPGNLLIPGPDS